MIYGDVSRQETDEKSHLSESADECKSTVYGVS
jgi:hypothetical protein